MWPKLGQCKSPSKSFTTGTLQTEVVSAPGTAGQREPFGEMAMCNE